MMVQNATGSDFQSFENKRQQLSECLEQAEKDLVGTSLDQTKKVAKSSILRAPASASRNTSKFRGKESIFKKPELPLTKCLKPRVTPDYKVNPHKWKKYSLSDVDISDRTNTAAAFAFLKEIEIKKDVEGAGSGMEIDNIKPVFNKSVRAKRDLKSEDEGEEKKPKLKGAKLMMPEYIVGQKTGKEKKKQRVAKDAASMGKQLMLSHLVEEEDVVDE